MVFFCIFILKCRLCTPLHCVDLFIVCEELCIVLLPPGVNRIAVNKIYHIVLKNIKIK